MMRVAQFFINYIYSKTSMSKNGCETDGCSSMSSTSLESGPGSKNWSFKSGRSPGAVHPIVGDAHPCGACQDDCNCRCSVNFSTAQPPGMISNLTTLVPGQVYDAIEGKKTSEPVPEPVGILRSGPSWRILEGHMPQNLHHESEFLASPRYDPSPVTPNYGSNSSLDRYANEELINERSTELTRDLTRASTAQRRLSPVPATSYPIAAQDRGSSSSNQSEIRDAEYRLSLIRDKSIEDEILQLPNHEMHVAGDINTSGKPGGPPLGPPSPCSQCNNEHHFGYCRPSKRFSLEELKDVTDNFNLDSKFNDSKDSNLYRGELDGRSVLVARKETYNPSDYFAEIDILNHVRHPYIVTLRGYCDEENSRALVFNFVCNGTLFYHLSSGNPNIMQWPNRVNLAVKLAKGLNYLHDRWIIHGNVTSKNIFVTHDFQPVIGEFSFSRNIAGVQDVILQNRKEDKKARGYLPPEYQVDYVAGRKLSKKLDIYAFGVILFELICGRSAFYRHNKTDHHLGEWGREKVKESDRNFPYDLVETMADPRLKGYEYDKDDMLKMINVAALCTSEDPEGRPLIPKVLEMLPGERTTKSIHKQKPPSSPSMISPLASSQASSAGQDTLVVETGSTMPSADTDHNFVKGLQLLRDHFLKEKCQKTCKLLKNICERAQQNLPEDSCKPPAKTRRNFCPPWNFDQRRPRPSFCPPWNPPPKRPPTPGHELLKKNNRSSGTHQRGTGTSTQYERSPKNSSSRKVSHPGTLRRVPMSPRRQKETVLRWYNRKSGGANLESRRERKERRVRWKRRPRPTFFNMYFSFD